MIKELYGSYIIDGRIMEQARDITAFERHHKEEVLFNLILRAEEAGFIKKTVIHWFEEYGTKKRFPVIGDSVDMPGQRFLEKETRYTLKVEEPT